MLRVNAAFAGAKTVGDSIIRPVELQRGPAAFPVEKDMAFDPLFLRHLQLVRKEMVKFRPDVVHITGPSDVGILGATLALQMRIPVVASWHTNLHEFGARRLEKALDFLPRCPVSGIGSAAEATMLAACALYYRLGSVLLAPNQELIEMLRKRTGKPVFLMRRGIDTTVFNPSKRTRQDSRLVFGYVGRITSEKGVRVLVDVERALQAAGVADYEFQIIGHGGETDWLRQNLRNAVFPGVLKGEALSQAYANMDVFLFPSRTDTFGNVILESLASGVPAIVTDGGGPKFLVHEGKTGFIASSDAHFAGAALRIALAPDLLAGMRAAARDYALRQSWDSVFQDVYRAYDHALVPSGE